MRLKIMVFIMPLIISSVFAKEPVWVKPCLDLGDTMLFKPAQYEIKFKGDYCTYSPSSMSQNEQKIVINIMPGKGKTGKQCAKDTFMLEHRNSGNCFFANDPQLKLSITQLDSGNSAIYNVAVTSSNPEETPSRYIITGSKYPNEPEFVNAKGVGNGDLTSNKLNYLIFKKFMDDTYAN